MADKLSPPPIRTDVSGADGKFSPTWQRYFQNIQAAFNNLSTSGSGGVGPAGPAGKDGKDGANGSNGRDGTNGINGTDGLSAFQIAVANGFLGDIGAWLASLHGADGANGTNGVGVPPGGSSGQVLTKLSATDFDTAWETVTGGGGSLLDQTRLYYFEDFISGLITSGQIGTHGWRYDGASGGAYFQTGMPNGTYRGVIQLISGTSWCGLYLGATYNNYQWVNPADTSIKFKTRLTPISSTQGKRRAGLLLQFGVADPSDGIYFEQTGVGNWFAITRAAGVETATDTGIAYVNGSWKNLEISISGSAATFKIDGTTVVSNQSTNFPTNWLLPGFECSYVSSNQAYMDIDYCLIDVTPAGTR